jgi:hypothetical protein
MTPALQLVQPTVIRTKLADPCAPYCDGHNIGECAHGKFFGPEEDSGAATVWLYPDADGQPRVQHFEAMGGRGGPTFTLDQAEARARSLLKAVRAGRGPWRAARCKSRASALR